MFIDSSILIIGAILWAVSLALTYKRTQKEFEISEQALADSKEADKLTEEVIVQLKEINNSLFYINSSILDDSFRG